MSESASALFSIADAGEFRFARFYIVCEEVPLGTPESPPIVSGVSDMHPSDCPNVEETRNPMQTFSRKKCSHFSPTNIPSAFPHEIPKCVSNNITYQSTICLLRQPFIAHFIWSKILSSSRHAKALHPINDHACQPDKKHHRKRKQSEIPGQHPDKADQKHSERRIIHCGVGTERRAVYL